MTLVWLGCVVLSKPEPDLDQMLVAPAGAAHDSDGVDVVAQRVRTTRSRVHRRRGVVTRRRWGSCCPLKGVPGA